MMSLLMIFNNSIPDDDVVSDDDDDDDDNDNDNNVNNNDSYNVNVKDNDNIGKYAYYDNDVYNGDDQTRNVQFILHIQMKASIDFRYFGIPIE